MSTKQYEAGKGSSSRPFSVSKDEFASRWDLIFKSKNSKDENKNKLEDLKKEEKHE